MPSTRVADESAGLRRALATPNWTSAHPLLQIMLQIGIYIATTYPPADTNPVADVAAVGAIFDGRYLL